MNFTHFVKWNYQFLYLSLLFSSFTLYSQTNIEKSIALDSYYNFYPFKEKGALVINSTSSKKKKKYHNEYTFYDTDLNPIQTKDHEVTYGFWKEATYSSSTHFHQLYTQKEEFILASIAIDSLAITEVTGVLPKRTSLSDMRVMGDYVYFKCISNKRQCLYSINWKTGAQKKINIFIDEERWFFTELYDYQLLSESEELLMYVNVGAPKNRCQRFLLIANPLGERQAIIEISEGQDKDFIEMSATKIGPESYVLVGTYTNRKILRRGIATEYFDRLQPDITQNHTDEGVFFAKIENNQVEMVKFYDFLSLANFIDFIPEEDLKKAKKKKRKKGLFYNIFSTDYQMYAHEIKVQNDGYLLLTEAFQMLFGPNFGRSFENRQRFGERYVFRGCDYQYAFIAKFDLNGALVWNNVFEFSLNFHPRKVKEVISIREQDDRSWKLVYPNKAKIAISQIATNGQLQQMEQELPQGFLEVNEAVGLHTWFDDNFLFSCRPTLIYMKDKRRKQLPSGNLLGKVRL